MKSAYLTLPTIMDVDLNLIGFQVFIGLIGTQFSSLLFTSHQPGKPACGTSPVCAKMPDVLLLDCLNSTYRSAVEYMAAGREPGIVE